MHMSLLIRWLAFQSRTQWVIPTSQDKTLRHCILLISSRTSACKHRSASLKIRKSSQNSRLIYFMVPLSARFVDLTKSRCLLVTGDASRAPKNQLLLCNKMGKSLKTLTFSYQSEPCFSVQASMCVTRSLYNIHHLSHAHSDKQLQFPPQVQP